MPDQITQKLGFDASSAITSLTNLNQKLGEFRQGLQATAGGLRKFEKQAATAILTFRELGRAAASAAGSVAQLRVASGGAVPPQVAAQARAASAAMNGLSNASAAAATASKQGAATTVASAKKVSASLTQAGKAGKQAAQTIGISWKTIGRIILAQGVIRGLSLIISTFNDAQEKAREFSLRIGEISTISGSALGSIQEISDATLDLSRNLGIATDEVAEGLYQTLSNQVVEAGEAMRFETTAAKLSITTHSELRESINALSSVMNSYNLDISEAEEVSATLFKTVELGRLRMGEFGDVLGRVAPLTAALGISYKEMAASLAAITQKGVPAHTAITQLTAVTQKLLRPTKGLQELYNKWGVETGPEAIRRFGGLRGVLLKMRDATAGNDKEFADLLGRVRSMVGALNLTTNEAESLGHALEEMKDPTDDLDAAFAKMESTIGRRSVKAWDDIDVSIHKAGQTFLEATTPMVEVLGTLLRNTDYFVAAMLGLGAGALLVSGKLAIAGAALLGFNVKLITLRATMLSILPIAVAMAAALATIAIKKAFFESVDTASDAFIRLKEHQEKLTKETEASSKKRIEATRKEVQERQALVTGFIAEEERLLRRGAQLFAIESEAIGDVLDDTLTQLGNKRAEAIKTVTDAITGMDDVVKDSLEIIKDTQKAMSDFDYAQRTKHLSEEQKLWSDIQRTTRQATKSAQAYKDAQLNEKDIQAARKLVAAAESAARKDLAAAERQGNAASLNRAVKNVKSILALKLKAEGTIVAQRKALDTAENRLAIKRVAEAKDRLEGLLELQKELVSAADADGKVKEPAVLKADRERAAALGTEIEKAIKESTDFSFVKELKVEDVGPALTESIQGSIQDATFQWDNAVSSLRTQLRSQTYTVNIVTNLEGSDLLKSTVKAKGPTGPTDAGAFEKIKQTAEEAIAKEGEALQQIKDASREAKANLLLINDNLNPEVWSVAGTEAARIATRLGEWSFPNMDAFRSASNEAHFKISGIAQMLAKATTENRLLTDQERKKVNDLGAFIQQQEKSGNLTGNRLRLAKQATHQFFAQNEALKKVVAAEQKIKDLGDEPTEAREFLGGLEATAEKVRAVKEGVKGVEDGIKAAEGAADQLTPALGAGASALTTQADEAGRLATNLNSAATSAVAAAQAIQQAAIASSMISLPSAAGTAFHGGPAVNYRAAGGPASRGADTIPVMASPDEFFMNARSSRRFATELQAMNAGKEPIFRDKGGSVTNVGDINVSVTSGETSNQTARQIASSLRRELRRGTSRLK